LDNCLHYFHALHKKPREHSSPFDKFSRYYLGKWFTSNRKLKPRGQKGNRMGENFYNHKITHSNIKSKARSETFVHVFVAKD
jgi:hypothetical protein